MHGINLQTQTAPQHPEIVNQEYALYYHHQQSLEAITKSGEAVIQNVVATQNEKEQI